jgi:hypothetical protein
MPSGGSRLNCSHVQAVTALQTSPPRRARFTNVGESLVREGPPLPNRHRRYGETNERHEQPDGDK